MLFLLLQTFAWMLLAGFVGAILGCLSRRIFAPVRAEAVQSAAVSAGAPVATRGPVVEASKAPATVGATAAPAVKPYDYPITTIGIPRGIPELVQPQIQKIDIPASSGPLPVAAAVATAADVKIVTPAAVSAAAFTYPITTIGIPPAVPGPFPPSSAPPAALAAVRGDAARFERALAGQTPAAAQPRPEPLRPELGRTAPPATPATPTPAAPSPQATSPVKAETGGGKENGDKLVPIAAAAAAAATAAAAAARATQVAPAAPVTVSSTAAAAAPAETSAAKSVAADDFTRIRAIDPDLQRRLNALGVLRFGDIAKLSPSDVARLSQTLGLLGRVEQENWIEQAQILASGGDTYYSRRRQRGEIPPANPTWASQPAPASTSGAGAATAAAAAAAAASAAMAAGGAAAATAAHNATVEPVKPAKLADAIRSNNQGGEAERPRSDLSGLRSVRSEALRPDVAATEGQRAGQPRPMSQIDDLKRVRGIGVLIEKKLNSLGVTTYEQIANWTNADIDRVSQILDFKGRIERENWVEQARILASGGHTEFSRRVDRGEA